jgi:hypothetical protein
MASLKIFCIAVLLAVVRLPAQSMPDKEYQVKAIFLFNFTKFVAWPTSSFPDAQTPLVVGILGNDPFTSYFDEIVKGEKVGDRPIKVVRYANLEEVKDCQILYVSKSETQRLDDVIDSLKKQHTLTVGESDLFSKHGGMISMVVKNGKVRIQINPKAAENAGITVSSKLLRICDIVTENGG